MGSSSFTLPLSTSCSTAAEVNCLVTEPMRKTVRASAGTSSSRLACPQPRMTTVSVPRTMATAMPGLLFFAMKAPTRESATRATSAVGGSARLACAGS